MENYCSCGIQVKQYTKFKKINNKIQRLEIKTCPKSGFTIDSSLTRYDESRDQPCEYYEETIITEMPEEISETIIPETNNLKEFTKDQHLTPLITYFLADNRQETYNKLVQEIPLKRKESKLEYIERLKKFLI